LAADLVAKRGSWALQTLAARLAAGPGAVRRAPRLLRENVGRDRSSALAAEAATQAVCLEGPDFVEAVSARLQGRDPEFVGR
jgi:enoyl-CoA hydratase/carnithine racemase